MQFHIQVHGPMLESEVPDFLESSGFNAAYDEYIEYHWSKYTKDLTQAQLNEVREWWGPSKPAYFPREVMGIRKDFYDTISKEAYDTILCLCCAGLG